MLPILALLYFQFSPIYINYLASMFAYSKGREYRWKNETRFCCNFGKIVFSDSNKGDKKTLANIQNSAIG